MNINTSVVIGTMRLPFLVITPVCVLLGAATAVWSGYEFNLLYFSLALIGALSAHISVNALNEYSDFKSGLDLKTEPTPFSGGSGTLPQHPDKALYALITGIITLGITASIGIFFLYVRGLLLLPLGLFGLILIVIYTNWVTKNPFLCLIAPGLGFGVMMVMGTNFVLTGTYSWTSFIASLIPFFLVSNLLLLNQFPDVEPDRETGRGHLPIKIGKKASAKVYGFFVACTFLSIIVGYLFQILPLHAFIALAGIFIAVPTVIGVIKYADDIPHLLPHMGKNVLMNVLIPLLLAVGLFFGN